MTAHSTAMTRTKVFKYIFDVEEASRVWTDSAFGGKNINAVTGMQKGRPMDRQNSDKPLTCHARYKQESVG